jgi:predicted O-methyltransferase YrrM
MAEARLALDDRLYAYLLSSEPPEHETLRVLRERTRGLPEAPMQIAREQGHFLAFLIRLTDARRVLELGTFTGYSALAMALALPPGGTIVTCDLSERWTEIGRHHWRKAGVEASIDLRIGPAVETLDRLEREGKPFDLAFVDADKEAYDAYYEATLRLVRPGGLIVFDNMLRRGRAADPEETDPDPVAIRNLNAKIAGDERVDRVLVPIGDGMTLARRRVP